AVDPTNGHVFVQESTRFYEFDPVANTWTARGDLGPSLSEDKVRTAAIDPVTRKFVVIGSGEFFAWDLNTFALIRPTTTGANGIIQARAPGLTWDASQQRLIAWSGGVTTYKIDTTTWNFTQIDPNVANTVTPTQPPSQGTFSRFQYIPSKNVLIAVNSIYEDVSIYRLASGIPPPTGQIPLPLKQWVALPAPQKWSTQGLPYEFKHVTPSYHPPSGRIYFTGGDHTGPVSDV